MNKIKFATLVYQGGIANVFSHKSEKDLRSENATSDTRERLIQSDFKTCAAFVRGLQAAGIKVRAAWCNEAGDIINSFWHFSNFDNAPFYDKFPMMMGN
jgi:hypothetical protein